MFGGIIALMQDLHSRGLAIRDYTSALDDTFCFRIADLAKLKVFRKPGCQDGVRPEVLLQPASLFISDIIIIFLYHDSVITTQFITAD
jgi:hypothetical protein